MTSDVSLQKDLSQCFRRKAASLPGTPSEEAVMLAEMIAERERLHTQIAREQFVAQTYRTISWSYDELTAWCDAERTRKRLAARLDRKYRAAIARVRRESPCCDLTSIRISVLEDELPRLRDAALQQHDEAVHAYYSFWLRRHGLVTALPLLPS